jgi:copper ion binding protein
MQTVEYQVPAIHCKHCVMTIKREVGELNGVTAVDGSLETKKVLITFEPPATQQSIEAFMAEIGYPVKK